MKFNADKVTNVKRHLPERARYERSIILPIPALSMLLVVVAMLISLGKLALEKYSVERMPGGDTAHYCRLCAEIHLWR